VAEKVAFTVENFINAVKNDAVLWDTTLNASKKIRIVLVENS